MNEINKIMRNFRILYEGILFVPSMVALLLQLSIIPFATLPIMITTLSIFWIFHPVMNMTSKNGITRLAFISSYCFQLLSFGIIHIATAPIMIMLSVLLLSCAYSAYNYWFREPGIIHSIYDNGYVPSVATIVGSIMFTEIFIAILAQLAITPFAITPIMLTAASTLTILFLYAWVIDHFLVVAAKNGSLTFTKILLVLGANNGANNGASYSIRNRQYRMTAQMWAAANGHTEVTIALMEQGADIYSNAPNLGTGNLFNPMGNTMEFGLWISLNIAAHHSQDETYLAMFAKAITMLSAEKSTITITKDMIEPLKILGISQSYGEISPKEIKKASLQNHPDKGGSNESFHAVEGAHRKLLTDRIKDKTGGTFSIELKQDLLEIAEGLDLAKSIASLDKIMAGLNKDKEGLREELEFLKTQNTSCRECIVVSIEFELCNIGKLNGTHRKHFTPLKERVMILKEKVKSLQEELSSLQANQGYTRAAEINPQPAMAAAKLTEEKNSSTPLPELQHVCK